MLDGAVLTNVNEASDIVDRLTGVQAVVANGTQVVFQIRGIGAVDHQALTPSAAAVYVDDVFLATNVQTGAMLYDVRRVEVLKGPQGVLYGRNSSAGAINFLTQRAGEEAPSYITASYGRFNRVDLQGAFDTALADTVDLRVAGRYLTQDAVLENVGPGLDQRAGGVRDEFGLRASLNIDIGSQGKLLLRGHYEADNGVNAAPRNNSLSDLEKHQIAIGTDGIQGNNNDFYGFAAEGQYDFADWTFFSLTAFEGYDQRYGFDFDGAPAPFGVPSLNANLSYDRDFSQISQEFRLSGERSWGHLLLGLYGAHEEFDQTYTLWCGELNPETLLGTCRYVGAPGRVGPNPASPGTATTLVNDISQDYRTFAAFANSQIDLTERLTLSLGGRITHENIEGSGQGQHIFDDGVIAFNNRDGVGPAIGENEITDTRFTGLAALQFEVAEGHQLYASVSNGYKAGGFNGEVINNATHFQEEGLFRAETVTAFEIGYKGTPFEGLRLEAAAFYQDYQDPQARIFVNFPLPDGSSITSNSLANLESAESYGMEASFDYTRDSGFSIGGSLTLLETEISQTDGANAAAFDGNPLPFASDVSFTMFARQDVALSDDVNLIVEGNAKYQSAFFLDAEGLEEREQEGYTIVDASATLLVQDAGVSVQAWVRNLLDKDYALSGFGFIGYNTFRSPPRTYGITARKEF